MSLFKSYNDLIDELKLNNKYDEWLSYGSYFGQISYTLKTKFFSVRPYQYYDMYDNIINVSAVGKTFRNDIINIPVFKQNYIEDKTNVKQNSFRIVNIDETLSTAGLATCCGLSMIIENKKFLTHLDAKTDIYFIIDAIKQIKYNKIIDVKIYAGCLDSYITVEKAKLICSILNIDEYKIFNVSMFDKIII